MTEFETEEHRGDWTVLTDTEVAGVPGGKYGRIIVGVLPSGRKIKAAVLVDPRFLNQSVLRTETWNANMGWLLVMHYPGGSNIMGRGVPLWDVEDMERLDRYTRALLTRMLNDAVGLTGEA